MKDMANKISSTRWAVACIAATGVFFLVVLTVMLWTFIAPETYVSSTRLMLRPESSATVEDATRSMELATQVELIRSEIVLGAAAAELNLAQAWGKKYAGGMPLRESEVLVLLRGQLEVHLIRNTSLAEIRVYSDSASEAAEIANQVAEAYRSAFLQHGAEIVDKAVPGLRPVRPNKPLNVALGVIIGALLGALSGGGVLLLSRRRD
jgi:uncharacterized protein involved in exopolysaccharide biosynthesis